MSSDGKITAIVVTHNRVAHLERCLQLLEEQTRAVDEILVVDNASTDDTPSFLATREGISVIRSENNLGGAGGFHHGMKRAWSEGCEWLWLMDDDSAPTATALARLMEVVPPGGQVPMVLASRVLWPGNGKLHPMNRPIPKLDPVRLAETVSEGLMPLRAASFVSCLVHRDAVGRYGLPHASYFIWNDDLEFTARVLRHEVGYWVPASVVHHETPDPYEVGVASPPKFYYEVRNKLLMLRGRSWSPVERVRWVKSLAVHVVAYLKHNQFSREALSAVARGLRDGLGPLP